jgi:lipoprotein-anchoring transpeptidase ErfK/SrfK
VKASVPAICLVLATAGLAQSAHAADPAGPDLQIVQTQVVLDRLGFSPGVIDGRTGQSLKSAISGFQKARGLPVTGELDPRTQEAMAQYREVKPTVTLQIAAADLQGPFVDPFPKSYPDQAKLDHLGYRNALEALSEKFHTTPATLAALNPPGTQIRAGSTVVFPNVAPTSRDYPANLPDDWRQTLSSLNVDAKQPEGDHVVVDKSDGVLRVFDAGDKLIAQFPATMGSKHDPLPIGSWTIKGAAYNPPFHYNPKLFWDASSKDNKAKLPPGPNGPVGVVWLDLSKEHYGIHGTPEPQTIGRSESHGCIRLTNWDAARLSLMVKPGTKAVFQK